MKMEHEYQATVNDEEVIFQYNVIASVSEEAATASNPFGQEYEHPILVLGGVLLMNDEGDFVVPLGQKCMDLYFHGLEVISEELIAFAAEHQGDYQ